MKTNKQTLIDNLEQCKINLIDADLSLYINNNDGKGWIIPEELEKASYLINNVIEYVEIALKNIQ